MFKTFLPVFISIVFSRCMYSCYYLATRAKFSGQESVIRSCLPYISDKNNHERIATSKIGQLRQPIKMLMSHAKIVTRHTRAGQ